ncbi:hypothetical protein DFJ58DRAFT_746697, partial [Suillus subalutaceus]|uniref:uncharacterized protein n=1 Tax=Suillus subalutaceus TaxID=48586 RepID=UPI001B86BB59
LLSVASGSSPLENIVQLSSAAVIIFEHSFYIFDKQRYQQQVSVYPVDVALEQYIASPHAAAVKDAVSAAFQAYQEAIETSVYTSKGKSPTRRAKLLFERLQRKDKKSLAKAELINTVLEIALNHRLPRP